MDEFTDVPKQLYSWIDDRHPFKTSMKYQIKYWWKTFSDLYRDCGFEPIVRVISREMCWIKVENLHGFMLNGSKVGDILVKENPSDLRKAFIIACRCCIEEGIRFLCRNVYDWRYSGWGSLNNFISKNIIRYEAMLTFWLDNDVEKMNEDNLSAFKCGLDYAIESNQLFAIRYFWDKINRFSANRVTNNIKDYMIMEYAIKAIILRETPNEIFEFFFSKMNPNYYSHLIKEDLRINHCCKSVPALLKTLHFEDAEILVDVLDPSDVTPDSYRDWLQLFEFEHLSGEYKEVALRVFRNMCSKKKFRNRRSHLEVIKEVSKSKKIL